MEYQPTRSRVVGERKIYETLLPEDLSYARGLPAADSDFVANRIHPRLVVQLQKNLLIPILSNSALACVVPVVLRHAIEPVLLWTWLALVLGWNVARYAYFCRLDVTEDDPQSQSKWARYYTISVAISGIIWGAAGGFLFASDQIQYQVFLAFMLGGLSAGAVAAYASWLPAFYAFVIPAIAPLVVCFFISMSELSIFMGAMLILFTGALSVLARSFNETLVSAISMQFNQARLLNEREVSEAFFSKAFHSSPALMAVARPEDGRHYDVNENWMNLTGYSYEEATSRSSLELGLWVRPEDRKAMIAELEETGTARGLETVFRTKQGEEIDLLVSGEYIHVAGEKRLLFIGQDISRLKEVERLKTEFLSIISHELRTPLTSIKGAIGLLQSGSFGEMSGEAARLLNLASRNSNRLTTLVNDILDFDKLRSGKLQFQYGNYDLNEIVKDAVEQSIPFSEESGVTLILRAADSPAVVWADNHRVGQVVTNVLSNAIKFSPEGQVVDIAVSLRSQFVRLEISDKGQGISEDFRDQVFDRFSQGDSSDTRHIAGTGLGLNISQAIVDQHGGKIDFVSAVGKGTTFYVELPVYGSGS